MLRWSMLALLGCQEGAPDKTPGASTEDADMSDPAVVRLLAATAGLPDILLYSNQTLLSSIDPNNPDACPDVAVDGGDLVASGGCTSPDGQTYGGTLTITDSVGGLTLVADAWSAADAVSSSAQDGVLSTSGTSDELLVADGFRFQQTGENLFPQEVSLLDLRWDSYSREITAGPTSTTQTINAALVEATLGAASLTGSLRFGDGCVAGSLTLNGAGKATISYDDVSCCATYTYADGSTETACDEG